MNVLPPVGSRVGGRGRFQAFYPRPRHFHAFQVHEQGTLLVDPLGTLGLQPARSVCTCWMNEWMNGRQKWRWWIRHGVEEPLISEPVPFLTFLLPRRRPALLNHIVHRILAWEDADSQVSTKTHEIYLLTCVLASLPRPGEELGFSSLPVSLAAFFLSHPATSSDSTQARPLPPGVKITVIGSWLDCQLMPLPPTAYALLDGRKHIKT